MNQNEIKVVMYDKITSIIDQSMKIGEKHDYALGIIQGIVTSTKFMCENLADDRPHGSLTIHAVTDEVSE